MDIQGVHRNCLKVQFGAQSKMPSDKEIFGFFRQRGWSPEILNAMFREPRDYSVYVKFQTEELMTAELLKCPATDEFRYANGETATVTFVAAKGNFKYVRLFGLPIEVEDSHVVNVISKYGKIHKVVRERYGADTGYPILNGVRGVYLEVSKSVPSQVRIQNFSTRISYEGMERECFSCGNTDHVKQDCPKRASVNDRIESARTFADVLSSSVDRNRVNLPAHPTEKFDQASEFPTLEELRQEFRAETMKKPVNQQQQLASGSESSPKVQEQPDVEIQATQQVPSSSGTDSSARDQVRSGAGQLEDEAMEGIAEQEAARKRVHEEGDSDVTSESSGTSAPLVQQSTEGAFFKVPTVNNLLENQVKVAKAKTKSKKSKN